MNINLDTAKDTLCKNILIYGYCKYENKGCAFSHNRQQPAQQQQATNTSNNSTSVITPNSANSTASSADLSSKRKVQFKHPFLSTQCQQFVEQVFHFVAEVEEIPVLSLRMVYLNLILWIHLLHNDHSHQRVQRKHSFIYSHKL